MGKKKDFSANPAMTFISPESVEAVEDEAEEKIERIPTPRGGIKPPAGFKLNPEFIEVRSKRFQLLLAPSVYKKLKARAKKDRVSMGEVVNRALAEYLGIERY